MSPAPLLDRAIVMMLRSTGDGGMRFDKIGAILSGFESAQIGFALVRLFELGLVRPRIDPGECMTRWSYVPIVHRR